MTYQLKQEVKNSSQMLGKGKEKSVKKFKTLKALNNFLKLSGTAKISGGSFDNDKTYTYARPKKYGWFAEEKLYYGDYIIYRKNEDAQAKNF